MLTCVLDVVVLVHGSVEVDPGAGFFSLAFYLGLPVFSINRQIPFFLVAQGVMHPLLGRLAFLVRHTQSASSCCPGWWSGPCSCIQTLFLVSILVNIRFHYGHICIIH